MSYEENPQHDVFNDLVRTGVLSTANGWIYRASEQRSPRLTLDLAYSTPLVFDTADALLLQITDLN